MNKNADFQKLLVFLSELEQQAEELPDRYHDVCAKIELLKGYVDSLASGTEQEDLHFQIAQNAVDLSPLERSFHGTSAELEDGILIIDHLDRVTFVDPKVTKLLEKDFSELEGKRIWDIFPTLAETPLQKHLSIVKETRQAASVRLEDVTKGRSFEVKMYPVQEGILLLWADKPDEKQSALEYERIYKEILEKQKHLQQNIYEARFYSRIAHATNIQTQSIFNNLIAVAILHEQNGVIQMANSFAIALFGFDPLRMNTASVFSKLQVRDENGESISLQDLPTAQAAQGSVVQNRKLLITNPRGRTYAVLVSSMPVQMGKRVTGVVSIWNDISRQERLLEENNVQRALLSKIISNAPVGIAVLKGPDYRFSLANAIVYKTTRTGEDITDKTAAEVWPDYQGQFLPALNEMIESLQPRQFQDLAFRAGPDWGAPAYFSFTFTPMLDEKGRVESILVLLSETTEQVRFRQQLQDEDERFRVALASAPIYVFTMDQELRYTWVYNIQHGFTESQVLGKRDEELFTSELAQALTEMKKLVLQEGKSLQREYKYHFRGQWFTHIFTLTPTVNATGEIVGIMGSAFDVSEQRRIEAQRAESAIQLEVQRRLLEYREYERQEIARDLHDGPIQNMVSNLFNLQRTKESLQDPEIQAIISQVILSIKNTIQDVRDVVNELRPPFVLHLGLSRAIRIHSQDIQSKNPGLILHLDLVDDEKLLPENTCLALYRIYQESLNNIIRHAEASEVTIRYTLSDQKLLLEIKDNGLGFHMPADWTGMVQLNHFGIPGMRERAEAIGGHMSIASEPGSGTQVRVEVPLP